MKNEISRTLKKKPEPENSEQKFRRDVRESLDALSAKLDQQTQTTKGIDMKVSQLADTVSAVADQVDKIKTEVQKLKDSLSDVELPAAATAALERLSAAVKAVDDINPDDV